MDWRRRQRREKPPLRCEMKHKNYKISISLKITFKKTNVSAVFYIVKPAGSNFEVDLCEEAIYYYYLAYPSQTDK
jgi:hypothetical protein